jgi:hypothetical protein
MVQDIVIYYEECDDVCGSNVCPETGNYFKHISLDECVSGCTPDYADATSQSCVADCPNGYTENEVEKSCAQFEFCHSTCGTCSVNSDASKCLTCTSALTGTYASFPTEQTYGPCAVAANNNAEYLLTVNENTVIGSGTAKLTSVTYNNIPITAAIALSTFLYTQKVIEFSPFTTMNTVVFNFAGLPAIHEKVIVRVRAFT